MTLSSRNRNALLAAEPATITPSGVAGRADVAWVAAVQAEVPAVADAQVQALRAAGLQRFAALGLPTPRQEAWRWFPVGHLVKPAFRLAPASQENADLTPGTLESLQLHDPGGARLVFVDGVLAPRFSRAGDAALMLLPLLHDDAAAVRSAHLGAIAVDAQHPFLALNDAFFQDGACVRVPRQHAATAPIHLLFVTTQAAAPRVSHPRVLLQVEEGAQVQVVQEHVGLAREACLVNAVTEAHVGAAASLRFIKLTHDSPATTHVTTFAVHAERDSHFESHCFSWNAGHVRNDVQVKLQGEGADCALYGLLTLHGTQVADDHTQVHHLKPHTTSVEHYRAVLDDQSRGAFSGAVFVAANAQQINSQQTSRNLLLSERALMNTKPELQILADDVKCSHGATIGQLDKEALFYLRSRGIDREEALRILTQAFGRAVVDHVPLEALRRALDVELFGGGESR